MFADFAAQQDPTYKFKLCCDATHDKGLQQFKLISVGWLGVHYSHGQWDTTFIPIGFALSPQEPRIV
eukprot:2428480-Pyramimonas_sp.AAC.2